PPPVSSDQHSWAPPPPPVSSDQHSWAPPPPPPPRVSSDQHSWAPPPPPATPTDRKSWAPLPPASAAGQAALRTAGVSAWFGKQKVLERVSLDMEPGKVTA